MPIITRHWVCPKCAAAFVFSETYFLKYSRPIAAAKLSQRMTEKRIRHRQRGCARDRGQSFCLLTSACVEHLGMPDDCHELTTLRSYRDRHLLATPAGASLVRHYYQIAPLIVQSIEISTQCKHLWEHVFQDLVLPVVQLIQEGENIRAEEHYKAFVLHLAKELDISEV